MTKKDFFILLIKVFGLYSVVISLFSILPSSISFAMYGLDAASIMWITIAAVVTTGLFILLIFKSSWVVSVLDLDKGFDDNKIETENLKTNDIIKIGTLIVGAILILNNIPSFLSHLFFAFKSNLVGMEYESKQKFHFATSALNIIIGYLLLTHYDLVANRLQIKNRDSS